MEEALLACVFVSMGLLGVLLKYQAFPFQEDKWISVCLSSLFLASQGAPIVFNTLFHRIPMKQGPLARIFEQR